MSDTNVIHFNSSQDMLSTPLELDDDDDDQLTDDYQPSTQEIIAIQTQEASNASDFFDNLRDSQFTSSQESNENHIKIQELTDVSIDSFNDCQPMVEKKKRGRKRKIRTEEEMEVHIKEKKEKNRLAAQRLRQKKGTEIAKYDQEVVDLEANVRAKRQFAELIESNVNQLRNKIKIMFGTKVKESRLDLKLEPKEGTNSSTSVSLSGNNSQQNSDQKRNKKQFTKLEPKDSNHFCISR